MKKKTVVLILLIFAYLLLCPQIAIASARDGLLLWYRFVLPVLFPFLFLGNLMMKVVKAEDLPDILTRPLMRAFGCSPYGAFVILTGFLCGLPLGAKLTGDLYRENKISRKEALLLPGYTNNLSPGFICSYLASGQMQMPQMAGWFLAQISGAALLYGLLCARKGRHRHFETNNENQKIKFPSRETQIPPKRKSCERNTTDSKGDLFSVIDGCIYDAIENVLRLGAYILLFSILSGALTQVLPEENLVSMLALSLIEVTGGVRLLAESTLPIQIKYLAVSALSASGGLCAFAQSAGIGHMDREMLSCYIKSRAKITLLAIILSFVVLLIHTG